MAKCTNGPKSMTPQVLRELCKKNNLYLTPKLNDVLYLHYQGFQDIGGLEEYTGLKCLWLQCNAIGEVKGLDNQVELRCLYLQNNLIKVPKIENLGQCTQLDTLDLSHNQLRRVDNCTSDVLPVLHTLTIAHNFIRTAADIEDLTRCQMLSVLDLSHNKIDDILVVKTFARMPNLRVLTLTGNPIVGSIPSYRKTLILECLNLNYLDTRPVFPKDRALAEAWKRGGYQAEKEENERWNREERRKMRENINRVLRRRNEIKGQQMVELVASSSDEEEFTKSQTEDLEVKIKKIY
uniref:Dynein axonemal assembly factor 1 homolog n=1 Tax=Lutzomyia longipalpis TaxID=7200 RepID=A0A1B0EUN9_LUTLO